MERLVYICEICQTILEERFSGMVCPNCGRQLDCSDIPALRANAKVREQSDELVLIPGSDVGDLLPWKTEPETSPEKEDK